MRFFLKEKILNLLLLISILSAIATAAYAREEIQIEWEGCVREALLHHPDLASASAGVKQTEADKKIAESARLPEISTELSGKKLKTAGMDDDTESYAYSIQGRQLIFDGSKTRNDIRISEENMNASQYNYAVTSSNIRLDLRVAFAGLLRAQELVSLTEVIAERKEQNVKLVDLRYEAGREHRGALLTARADLAQAAFEVEQAKRNLMLAQTRLINVMGWEKKAPVKAEGEFRTGPIEDNTPDFAYLADHTPLLSALAARKQSARYGLKSAQKDFYPQVYFSASAGKKDSDWLPDESEWVAGMSVTFPLFEGGKRFAQVSKAKEQLAQAAADERSGRDGVILTLEETWINFRDAVDRVDVQRKFLDAAEERARIANAQYSTGLISFDDWIIIENNLVFSKKAHLNARADMLIAEARWFQAKGWTLNDG
jgi:outer membrane protein TolC